MAQTAIVTGATGQDGWYLVRRLLADGWVVHAPVRDVARARALFDDERFRPAPGDLRDPATITGLVAEVQPDELYNLAGESSVSASFEDPWTTWLTNAHVVVHLLDAVRNSSPHTRVYQASSGDMFGSTPGGEVVHDESSALTPQSPYAAAKAAAHMLCRSYRESYDVRIACGILFNHESRRRGPSFLSRKVVDHLLEMERTGKRAPLFVGNLKVQRDWGFAPEYVEGMIAILRQTAARGDDDTSSSYRDYVLGTGRLHAVWQLIDTAYRIAGHELEWNLDGDDALRWSAAFSDTGKQAIGVDRVFVRHADPRAIAADPSLIERELGWAPSGGLEVFLHDMLYELSESPPRLPT